MSNSLASVCSNVRVHLGIEVYFCTADKVFQALWEPCLSVFEREASVGFLTFETFYKVDLTIIGLPSIRSRGKCRLSTPADKT